LERAVVYPLGIKLLLDIALDTDASDSFQILWLRAECHPIEHMGKSFVAVGLGGCADGSRYGNQADDRDESQASAYKGWPKWRLKQTIHVISQ
jgi:hypothetical protein